MASSAASSLPLRRKDGSGEAYDEEAALRSLDSDGHEIEMSYSDYRTGEFEQ